MQSKALMNRPKKPLGLRIKRNWQKNYMVYIVLAPVILHFAFFILLPVASSAVLSFTNYNLLKGTSQFIGLQNWKNVFADEYVWRSLRQTLKYSLWYIPGSVLAGLGLAALVNREGKGIRFFRSVFFLPSITSAIVLTSVWKVLFTGQANGIINTVLTTLGLVEEPVAFYAQKALVLPIIASLAVFMSAGTNMVYFLGGLKGIPSSLYESAMIDGASKWKMFIRITLPLLRPTLLYVLILTTIGSFQVFDTAYVLTMGGPNYESTPIVYQIYQSGFKEYRFGYAATISYILFFIIGIIAFVQYKWLNTEVNYD